MKKAAIIIFCIACISLSAAKTVKAQQLEPRAYSPAPTGANFVGIGYLYSSGGAVLDPSLPVENVEARVQMATPFYARTFDLFGRLANVGIVTPFAHALVSGDVMEERKTVERTGLGDAALRLAVNLFGLPALTPREFQSRKPETTLGASLVVTAPVGQYDPAKLINLGTNRWAFRPELGLSCPVGKWDLELYAGVWLFTGNPEFFGNHVRRQDPLEYLQTHIVYELRTHMWAALDFTYYQGGSTTVDGQSKNDRQANTRAGLTLALPVSLNQSVKLTCSRGVTTRIGSSFDTIGAAWQMFWF